MTGCRIRQTPTEANSSVLARPNSRSQWNSSGARLQRRSCSKSPPHTKDSRITAVRPEASGLCRQNRKMQDRAGEPAAEKGKLPDPCQPNPGQSVAPPGCDQESALVLDLPAGAYTAIVSGVGGQTGVGLVGI